MMTKKPQIDKCEYFGCQSRVKGWGSRWCRTHENWEVAKFMTLFCIGISLVTVLTIYVGSYLESATYESIEKIRDVKNYDCTVSELRPKFFSEKIVVDCDSGLKVVDVWDSGRYVVGQRLVIQENGYGKLREASA